MVAVVESDRHQLDGHRGMQQPHLLCGMRQARGLCDLLPPLETWDEADRPRLPGVVHDLAVEPAQLDRPGRIDKPHRPHRPCSVRSTLSALIARGKPAYGAV